MKLRSTPFHLRIIGGRESIKPTLGALKIENVLVVILIKSVDTVAAYDVMRIRLQRIETFNEIASRDALSVCAR